MNQVFASDYSFRRTFSQAYHAGFASIRIDIESNQFLAHKSRAALLPDMRLILILEIPNRAQNRIRRASSQGTERGIPCGFSQSLQKLQVFLCPAALADPGQNFQHICHNSPPL